VSCVGIDRSLCSTVTRSGQVIGLGAVHVSNMSIFKRLLSKERESYKLEVRPDAPQNESIANWSP
jgi:hypothetical protein